MIRIENIGGKSLPNYVLFTPKGLIAIDTGFEWKRKAFMEGLRKTGETLQYLFLTHSHDDHVGFAKKVIDVTGASLIVHHASIPALVRGGCEIAKHGAYTSKRVAVLGRIQSVLNMPKAGFSPLTIKSSDIVIANETQQPFADIGIRIVFLRAM